MSPHHRFMVRSSIAILLTSLAAGAALRSQEEKKDSPGKEETGKSGKDQPAKKGTEKKAPGAKGAEKKAGDKKGADKKSEKGSTAAEGKTDAPGSKPADDPDVQLVKERLKEFIHGTIAFDPQNVVTIEYDLKTKKEELERDFLPPINPRVPSHFRWSTREEEFFSTGDKGVRISDTGTAMLNLWFKDDVEATMEFLNGIGWSKQQVCAIVFQAKNGQGIGNNYGGQCAVFSGGAFKGGTPPATLALPAMSRAKFGLRVQGGTYEALLGGKSRQTSKYSARSLSSGRIGFVWGGKVAGTITSISIKGKIDFAAAAKDMKKASAR